MSYVCPRCGIESQHPMDEKYGYCGRCHDWTGTEPTFPTVQQSTQETSRPILQVDPPTS